MSIFFFFPEIMLLIGIILIIILWLFLKQIDQHILVRWSIWIMLMAIVFLNNLKIESVIILWNLNFIISPLLNF